MPVCVQPWVEQEAVIVQLLIFFLSGPRVGVGAWAQIWPDSHSVADSLEMGTLLAKYPDIFSFLWSLRLHRATGFEPMWEQVTPPPPHPTTPGTYTVAEMPWDGSPLLIPQHSFPSKLLFCWALEVQMCEHVKLMKNKVRHSRTCRKSSVPEMSKSLGRAFFFSCEVYSSSIDTKISLSKNMHIWGTWQHAVSGNFSLFIPRNYTCLYMCVLFIIESNMVFLSSSSCWLALATPKCGFSAINESLFPLLKL